MLLLVMPVGVEPLARYTEFQNMAKHDRKLSVREGRKDQVQLLVPKQA